MIRAHLQLSTLLITALGLSLAATALIGCGDDGSPAAGGSDAGEDAASPADDSTTDDSTADDSTADATTVDDAAQTADAMATPEDTQPDAGPAGDDAAAAPPAPITCAASEMDSHTLVIRPYLQDATPTSVWILWETEAGEESRVDWGLAPEDDDAGDLDQTTCGGLVLLLDGFELGKGSFVHEVQLTGLEPGTRYQYRVQTGAVVDGPYVFQTLPAPEDEGTLRLVATSDMQRDDGRPEIFDQLIAEGVIPFVTATFDERLESAIDVMLVPGDLVDNGWIYEEWEVDFFAAAAEVLASVPMYPVLGNHEGHSFYYYRYFRLPENGKLERWYHTDLSNVRLIGLDSTGLNTSGEQLAWLDEVLAATCDLDDIDFVIAQLHHPFRSEVWTPGNTEWTGEVVRRLEDFATECARPTVHLFGHTHAYSRGQSRDHQHLMVNVAGGGGRLDRWGEQSHEDYDEFTVSEDHYGFVVMEISAGDQPTLHLTRVTRGTPEEPLDNIVSDEITIRRYGDAPTTPTAVSPIDASYCLGDAITLSASDFDDPEGDAQQAADWQVFADCDLDADPVATSWRQDRNLFAEVDSQAGDDLQDEIVGGALTDGDYCWRVRYRDSTLRWSSWSAPEAFAVGDCE